MKKSKKIAICGMTVALSVTIMFLGNILPLATYICPAFAACLILPIAYEFRAKYAFCVFLSVSFLSTFVIFDKEIVLMYILVFGLYTTFKINLEKINSKLLKVAIKIIYPFLSMGICYFLLLVVFPNPLLLGEFSEMGGVMIAVFFVLFAFTFLVYDFALSRAFLIYRYRLRKKLVKKHY